MSVVDILRRVEERLRSSGLLRMILDELRRRGYVELEGAEGYLRIEVDAGGCYRWTGEFEGWGCELSHVVDVVVMYYAGPEVERLLRRGEEELAARRRVRTLRV